MRYLANTLLLITSVLLLSSNKSGKRVSMLGKEVPAFELRNTDGKMVSMNGYRNAKGFIVVFSCNHCPFAKLYTTRLNALNTKYKAQNVPLLVVNPMDSLVYEDENTEGMKAWAKSQQYNFPYLQDAAQSVAKTFYAAHTPQAFVVWKTDGKWIVRYSGAIDDNGKHPELAHSYIATAVDELLQRKTVSEPENLSFGCAIHYR